MELCDLHPSIGKLRTLQSLSLQHNNLYDLPFTVEWLDQLEYLDVSGNFFTIFPRAVYHLKSLKLLIGLNSCPLIVRPEWRRCKYREWSYHQHCISSTATTLQQPQTLKDAAFNSALGINCWNAGLPRKYCALLTESDIIKKRDLCENCCKPILKVTPEQEPVGVFLFMLVLVCVCMCVCLCECACVSVLVCVSVYACVCVHVCVLV